MDKGQKRYVGKDDSPRGKKRQRGGGDCILTQVALWFPQHDFDCAMRSMFHGLLDGFKMPCVEDIMNRDCFVAFLQWNESEGTLCSSHPPSWANVENRNSIQATLGKQLGAPGSKRALPPLADEGGGARQHLLSAMRLSREFVYPGTESIDAEPDLRFAADLTIRHLQHLREFRQECRGALRELVRRLMPLSRHLRRFQAGGVASVAGGIHIALIAALVYIMRWPDRRLPWRFIYGFSILGKMERTGVFRPTEAAPFETRQNLLAGHKERLHHWKLQSPDRDADFLWECCLKDAKSGFGAQPVPETEMDTRWGVHGWCSNPRFCVTQPSGKRRPIDDGKRAKVNAASSFEETLVLCTAFQPCICARLVVEQARVRGVDLAGQMLESGGEDLPDAYRHVPVAPEDYCCNIAATTEPVTKLWMFQEMWGLLFGHASAVLNFNRWPRFLEAVCRRVSFLMVALYFDDANIVDFQAALGSGQAALNTVFELFGTPFARKKKQPMTCQSDFLGLIHNLRHALDEGWMSMVPRGKIVEDAMRLIEQALETNHLTPAVASKIFGKLIFMSMAFVGKVGRVGTKVLAQRMYFDTPPWRLSFALTRALYFLQLVLTMLPSLRIDLWSVGEPLVVIASDAQADPGSQPSAGYIMLGGSGDVRKAGFNQFPEQLLALWGYAAEVREAGGNPIALCEAAVVLFALWHRRKDLANQRIIWFVDNTAALQSLVKGSSSNQILCRIVEAFHIICFHLKCRVWLEYVQSADNWSDGISRYGREDCLAKELGIVIETFPCSSKWFTSDLQAIWESVGLQC